MAKYLRPRRGKYSYANSQDIMLKRGEMFLCLSNNDNVGQGPGALYLGDGASSFSEFSHNGSTVANTAQPILVHPMIYKPIFANSNPSASGWTVDAATSEINNIGNGTANVTLPNIIGNVKGALSKHADSINALNSNSNKVTQTPDDSSDGNFEFLFSGTADNTEHTEGAKKSSGALYNPSKHAYTFGSRATGSTVGNYSFAEGNRSIASGVASHAEGVQTIASGAPSHAEGFSTTASETGAHAEGYFSKASGIGAHAEGYYTEAASSYQHVFGKYNTVDSSDTYVEIVGKGTGTTARSNARTLDWSGNETLAGKITVGAGPTNNMDVATKQYVDTTIDNLPEPMVYQGTLGTGGTITNLPAAAEANKGFTYKVITDGTYASQQAHVGDMFTSNGTSWVRFPAGDPDTDTWRPIKVNGTEVFISGISSGSVNFINGNNTTVSFNSTNKTIQVNATSNTTYSNMTSASAGLAPAGGSGTTKYLRQDGTWQVPPDNNTTYAVATTASNGLLPKLGGGTTNFLRADGTWVKPDNTTYSNMTSASAGLAPAGGSGTTKYLRQDGSWQVPPNTTYSNMTSASAGLAPAGGSGTTKYLRQDGTWQVPPDNNTTYGLATTASSGLMPKLENNTSKYLRSDGTWGTVSTSDTKVTQTPDDSTNGNFEFLFSGTADNTEHTEGAKKSSGALYNPSKHAYTFGSRNASTVGNYSFTEGYNTMAASSYSHAEGTDTTASGNGSHAEGNGTTASSQGAHAEGYRTKASGILSHAEGNSSTASGESAHAEGYHTKADGIASHAEGNGTSASSSGAHAEGNETAAVGVASHAEGSWTIAASSYQHVFGKYNTVDSSDRYVEIVGKGASSSARSNARTLDWSGNETLAGKLTVGTQPTANMDVATKKYVDDAVTNAIAQVLADSY